MSRLLAPLIIFLLQTSAQAQLMQNLEGSKGTEPKIRVASDVPTALQDKATLRFELLDICFDGGSHGAFFERDNGSKLVLFFPHPGYWTPAAKRDSRQPVAIQGRALVEIAPKSALEARLLELLAEDIVDGQRSRKETLTLIRIRDCLLSRKPLAEIVEHYDPKKAWGMRPEMFEFEGDDPFDDGKPDAE